MFTVQPADLNNPTIVARLTAPGHAALGTLGILGPHAFEIVRSLFSGRLSNSSTNNRPAYGMFGDTVRDDVVVDVRNTDLPLVEIHCHGGQAMVAQLLDAVQAKGAQVVTWQEFFARQGFSEIQVEAALALSQCRTERTAAILLDQWNGALDREWERLVGDVAGREERISRLLEWGNFGIHLHEPWKVAFFGRPNVGKSSLLNAIAGYNRAIVLDRPGTTRDVLTAEIALDGWAVTLVDGAGIREEAEMLEKQGIKQFERFLKTCDLRILVTDASAADPADQQLESTYHPDLIVANKSDLSDIPDDGRSAIRCSAKTMDGIDRLVSQIVQTLVPNVPPPGAAIPFTHRQIQLLQHWHC